MLSRNYLERLKLYLGKDVNISDNGSEIRVYINAEIQYFLRKSGQRYILYIQERGKESEEREYMSETEMKRNFAIWMKNIFSENIKYPFSDKFREVRNVSELKNLMYQYANESLYSINDLAEEKINIKQDESGLYSIFFVDKKGNKYILEQEEEAPFVFKRFYNEVAYYGEIINQIREYEEIFEDELEYKTKIGLLGY